MVYSYGDNFRNLTMNKNYFLIKILIIYLFTFLSVFAAQSSYFNKGKKLFDNNEFDKSKFFFERDIVFNPKSESSYLYLAKIYNKNNNDLEQEMNLSNVLIINPQNDEAIYMLTILRIKQSDYNGAKELIEKFDLVCKSFCSKKKEIQEKFEKLKP